MIIDVLIPARGGSKRIPGKNIKTFCDKPLIAWSIMYAQQFNCFRRIVVSTDSELIKTVSLQYNAEVIDRPKEISGDLSTDLECFNHYLQSCEQQPDIIVHLRPTYPMRQMKHLYKMLELIAGNQLTSVRSVIKTIHPPFKTYTLSGNVLKPLVDKLGDCQEPYNAPTQLLPTTYRGNGYIDVVKSSCVRQGSMSGDKIGAFVLPDNYIYDIDTMDEWTAAEQAFNGIN